MKMRVCAGIGAAVVLASGASASFTLWDNGGMVTHPGEGAGGFDVSMAGTDITSAGSNARQTPAGDGQFRIADDFTVSGGSWLVDSITVFAYETNENTPTWDDAEMNVWDGSPDDPGSSIVATFDSPTVEQTDIYRVFNGSGNLDNTARLINSVTFDLEGTELSDGNYWIDWQVIGGGSGWASFVMEPNPSDPNDPTTVVGNGLQLNADLEWQALADEGAETPFIVTGVPAPGAVSLLALGGLVAVRRRRA